VVRRLIDNAAVTARAQIFRFMSFTPFNSHPG